MNRPDHLSVHYQKKALPISFTRRLLRGQQQRIYERFIRQFPPDPQASVLDLGVNGSLDRPELYFFEHSYPYKERVVAAGLEEGGLFHKHFPAVSYVRLARGEPLPFEDQAFDVVFCNAVLEHVGSRENQRRFLAEILRVGRCAFITTPNRWYPVELHTVTPLLHWLPARVYRRIYRWFGFHFFAQEENLNLLDRRALWNLLPSREGAAILSHRFLGLISNLLLVIRRPISRS